MQGPRALRVRSGSADRGVELASGVAAARSGDCRRTAVPAGNAGRKRVTEYGRASGREVSGRPRANGLAVDGCEEANAATENRRIVEDRLAALGKTEQLGAVELGDRSVLGHSHEVDLGGIGRHVLRGLAADFRRGGVLVPDAEGNALVAEIGIRHCDELGTGIDQRADALVQLMALEGVGLAAGERRVEIDDTCQEHTGTAGAHGVELVEVALGNRSTVFLEQELVATEHDVGGGRRCSESGGRGNRDEGYGREAAHETEIFHFLVLVVVVMPGAVAPAETCRF